MNDENPCIPLFARTILLFPKEVAIDFGFDQVNGEAEDEREIVDVEYEEITPTDD